jgi:hypothetical protein
VKTSKTLELCHRLVLSDDELLLEKLVRLRVGGNEANLG